MFGRSQAHAVRLWTTCLTFQYKDQRSFCKRGLTVTWSTSDITIRAPLSISTSNHCADLSAPARTALLQICMDVVHGPSQQCMASVLAVPDAPIHGWLSLRALTPRQ